MRIRFGSKTIAKIRANENFGKMKRIHIYIPFVHIVSIDWLLKIRGCYRCGTYSTYFTVVF